MRAQWCAAPQASITTVQLSCFSKNAINSLLRNLRLISTFPASFTPWIWNTDLDVSRPIMLTLIVGGSLVAGFDTPHCGTSMPLGGSSTLYLSLIHISEPT